MDCNNSILRFVFKLLLLRKVFVVVFLLFLASCSSDDEIYTYDKTGFVPTRYVPYTRPSYNSYPGYGVPRSRVYQNPYEIYHPNPYYPSYYDQDYYYVPPRRIRNTEPTYSIDQKS